MSFLPFLQGGLGLLGAISGMNSQNKSNAALQSLINGIMHNQQGVQSQLLNAITGMQGTAGNYLSILPSLANSMQAEAGGAGAQAPGAAEQFMRNSMDPNALYGQTGVNTGTLANNALSYLGNPGGTNLSANAPSALSFFANQMQNGIDPHAAQNAQSQLGQQFTQSLNTMRGNLAPGQNPAALERQSQNDLLSASTNLAGNLAGESQQLKQAGAQGLVNTSSGLDAQKLNMLAQAFGLGNQYNQTVLGNEQAGANFGQNILAELQNFANTGNQLNEFGVSSLGNLDSNLLQEGEYFSGLGQQAAAQNAQSNPFSALGGILANLHMLNGKPQTVSNPLSNMPAPTFGQFSPQAPPPDYSFLQTGISPQSYQPYNMGPMP